MAANVTAIDALWRAYYRTFPPVLVVLADQTPTAARRRVQKTIALYRSDPSQDRYGNTPTTFTTLPELTAHGPFAPIFIPTEQPDHFTDCSTKHDPRSKKTMACTSRQRPCANRATAQAKRKVKT